MKTWFKSFFKGWNAFEYVMLFLALTVVPVLGILFKSSIFEVVASTGGSVVTILFAKGKIEGYFIACVTALAEAIADFKVALYGSVILIFAASYPMIILGIYSWAKNKRRDKEKGNVVRVGSVNRKDLLVLCAALPILFLGLYLLLGVFNTRFLLLSTFSASASLVGAYLIARRSRMSFFAYIIADILGIVAWTLLFIEGHMGAISMVALCVIFLLTDVYAVFEWQRLEKSQEKSSKHKRIIL